MSLETQWRLIAGMGAVVYQGIDYSAVHALLKLTKDPYPAYRFACLKWIERGALSVLNRVDKK